MSLELSRIARSAELLREEFDQLSAKHGTSAGVPVSALPPVLQLCFGPAVPGEGDEVVEEAVFRASLNKVVDAFSSADRRRWLPGQGWGPNLRRALRGEGVRDDHVDADEYFYALGQAPDENIFGLTMLVHSLATRPTKEERVHARADQGISALRASGIGAEVVLSTQDWGMGDRVPTIRVFVESNVKQILQALRGELDASGFTDVVIVLE